MSYITGGIDPQLAIALEQYSNIQHRNIFGLQLDADTGTVPVDVWSIAKTYTPPTSAQTIDVTAGANDAGALRSTGLITTASINQIVDSAANFVADGVVSGDIVLNDTTQEHSIVVSVASPNILDVLPMHHGNINEIGDTYRIVQVKGTGAAVVQIREGLDASLNMQSEFIILDTTNIVSTVNQYSRINLAQIHGVGSDGKNSGDVDFTAQIDGTLTAQIPAGYGQSTNTFYTVPRGYDAFITNIYASLYRSGVAKDAMAQMSVYERLYDGLGYGSNGDWIRGTWGVSVFGASGKPYQPYIKISEYSDVWIRVEDVSDDNSVISAGYDIILVQK